MRLLRTNAFGLLTLLAVCIPLSGHAQGVVGVEASRWLPWIGCWEGAADSPEGAEEPYLVCFQNLADDSGVEIQTFVGGEMVALEDMRALGTPVAVQEEGCTGEQIARWSEDGRRIFVSSEMNCGTEIVREARGTLAVLPEGRGWVEIHAVDAGGGAPFVGIRSFVPASTAAMATLGIANPASGRTLAVSTARARASEPLTQDAIVELVERAGPQVSGSLIAERNEPFRLDAQTLQSLAERGVPGDVLDVMVAVTYPERFTVTGGTEVAEVPTTARSTATSAAQRPIAPWPPRSRAYRGYSPWGFGYYGYSNLYDRYGYGSGRYGYGYGPFGPPYYGFPRVIVIDAPVVEERSSILSRNRGVVPTGSSAGSPSSTAAPSSQPPARTATPRPSSSGQGSGSTAPSPPRTTTGSSAPSRGNSGGSSGSAPDGERRAVPRSGG